jgi:hypothetical protein
VGRWQTDRFHIWLGRWSLWKPDPSAFQEVLDGVADVLAEMPAVAHLPCQRSPSCCGINIGIAPISAHYIDIWVDL